MRRIKADCVYGADFETDHDGATAWVIQWSVSDGSDERYGRDIGTYRDYLYSLILKHQTVIVYFHNLKYDMYFQTSVFQTFIDDGFVAKFVIRKGQPIKLRFDKDDYSIEFRDSMKKLPGNLKSVGKLIGLPK